MAVPQNPELTIALNHPHQLFLMDRVLKTEIGAFVSQVTLGNATPAGQVIAVATITVATDVLQSMAKDILAAISSQAPKIKAEHGELQKKLTKS